MPDNRNRLRPKQIKFFVNDKEYDLIRKKMAQMGTDNMSAYIRKMVIDGYVVNLELPELRELTSRMKRISNSENQIAKRLNETGNIYEANFEKIKKNEGFGMFPNKFLQRAASLKFAKSTSVSTRALLAKYEVSVWVLTGFACYFAIPMLASAISLNGNRRQPPPCLLISETDGRCQWRRSRSS